MKDRLATLRRLEAVQKQLVRLSTWRAEQAEQACRELDADRDRLRDYIVTVGAVGAPLAKAALKSAERIETRRVTAHRALQTELTVRATRKAREHVVSAMVEDAALASRRCEEDRDLATTMEAWLATSDASLP